MKLKYSYILFLSMVLLTSCSKKVAPDVPHKEGTETYLCLSHTRADSNPHMDAEVELVDYTKFDMLWLGGDLAVNTSADDGTLEHLDSILNLSSEDVLWALGNHDYSNLDAIRELTDRKPFFTYHKSGITFIILDTQDSMSNVVGEQLQFFNSVIDTISTSSHLVLLQHKLTWMYDNPDLEDQIDDVSNGPSGDCFYCINPNNFYTEIYPKLLKVKGKGIEIICIAGDRGFKKNEFEYISEEGITFLATGIKSGDEDNQALIFSHDLELKELTWHYELVSGIEKIK